MQSVFDPRTLESMTFTDKNSTETFPCPVGDWPFEITKRAITQWENKDKTKAGLKLVLTLKTEDPEVVKVTGRSVTLDYEIMLDLTEDGTGLDFGKGMNARLGRAREACNLNNDGQPFAFDMFVGHHVLGSVTQEIWKERPIANVKEIARA